MKYAASVSLYLREKNDYKKAVRHDLLSELDGKELELILGNFPKFLDKKYYFRYTFDILIFLRKKIYMLQKILINHSNIPYIISINSIYPSL